MSILPKAAQPLLHSFAGAFTRPTFKRFLTLMLGAVLTTGRRTITNLLRAVRGLAPGHPSSYHRVFSRRRWSPWTLGHALADFIVRRWVPQVPCRWPALTRWTSTVAPRSTARAATVIRS